MKTSLFIALFLPLAFAVPVVEDAEAENGHTLVARKGKDHSKHNCCWKGESTAWKWMRRDDLTQKVCENDYKNLGAMYQNYVCKENASISRIDGQDFENMCQNRASEVGITDRNNVKGAYRAYC